jgi:dolichyl-phosphate beta-glucosyltransferase
MSEEIYLSIIIPGRNEEKRIAKTLDAVAEHLSKKDYNAEIIFVDGGSTDKTIEVVQSKKNEFIKLHVIEEGKSMSKHGGKGIAVKLGMIAAIGKYKCFIDADNGAPFEQIDKLFEYIDEYDVVIGSRYIEGNKQTERSLLRTIISRGGSLFFKVLIGENLKDTRCPLKLFRGDVAQKLFHFQKLRGFGFDTEIFAIARKYKYTVKEVPVEFHDVAGSTVTMMDTLKSFWEGFQIRWFLWNGSYKDKK